MTGELVKCQNCHSEMTAGRVTKSKVMEYTEYLCPNNCSPWSEAKPLPGHEPTYIVPRVKAVIEIEVAPEPKKKRRVKAAGEAVESGGDNGC